MHSLDLGLCRESAGTASRYRMTKSIKANVRQSIYMVILIRAMQRPDIVIFADISLIKATAHSSSGRPVRVGANRSLDRLISKYHC